MDLHKLLCFFVIIAMMLPLRVYAAEFADDMSAATGTEAVQYTGLKPYAGNVNQLSDSSMLTFTSIASPKGRVTYRVNNAGEVTAAIYNYRGTAVSQGEDGLVTGQGGIQAKWSGQSNAVYTDIGGMKQLGVNNRTKFYMFLQVVTPPASDVAGYGVNFYFSINGASFLQADAKLTRYAQEATLYYEEYTAAVPATAKYVAVEINDVTSLPVEGGGYYQIDSDAHYTRLASVRISGEGLVMGEPVKETAQLPASVAQPSGQRESREIEVNLAANELTPEISEEKESEREEVKEKSSPSKFEGTIVSSSRSEKPQSSKAARDDGEPPPEKAERSQSVSESEPPRDQTVVYELRREEKGGLLESGVTVYIIVVAGTIVLLVIFGKKR